jgi:hypothetical protein
MRVNLKTELLQAAGFSEEEIQQIQQYCDAAEASGQFHRNSALVWFSGKVVTVSQTIAEILDTLRPGCWLKAPVHAAQVGPSRPDNLIELHYKYPRPRPGMPTGESLWALQIGKNTAKVDNIPFFTSKLACGDTVRFDKNRKITKILEHVARTRGLVYADKDEQTLEEIRSRYDNLCQELKKHDIYAESMFPGVCSLSVPKDMSDDELTSITDRLGAQLVDDDGV